MTTLLISGGRIIDPGRSIDRRGHLLIAEGKIKSITEPGATTPGEGYKVIDAEGLIVCPGFIDCHCHLRQPGFEDKETIASGSQAAARGGFTTICCMPNTQPPLDSAEMIDYVNNTAAKEAAVRVLPIGCISRGRQGKELADMDSMVDAGAVAFSDDGDSVMDNNLMQQALQRSLALGLPVYDHCEDKSLNEADQGASPAAEESVIARDIELARCTGGHIHIAHVSTHGAVELIRRARITGVNITAEATPHHLTLTQDCVAECGNMARVNPPLRSQDDVAALVEGLNDGTIDIIATDHAPHTAADKQGDFSRAAFGISGFETALGSLMGLVHRGRIELTTLIARLTSQPARTFGGRLSKLGTLEIGSIADVVIFDPDLEWTVNAAEFVSKGKNTPLDGKRLKGKVIATIYNGNIVYKDDSLSITEGRA
jgi:dihydroorotase